MYDVKELGTYWSLQHVNIIEPMVNGDLEKDSSEGLKKAQPC